MICNECNAKNAKNDKFCRNCGKSLGEANTLAKNNNIEGMLKNALEDIKGIFVKPVDTAKNFIKDSNYMTSLIYLSANVLFLSLFVLVLVKAFSGAITGFLGFGYLDSFYETIEIPYFRIFLIAIMTGVITYGLLAGMAYLISNYLFKSKTSFKQMLTWLGINSLLNSVVLIVVSLGLLISVKLGLVLYLIGEVLYTFNLFRTFEYATDTDKNKLGYVLMPTIMVTLLVVIVILPKIFF